MISTISDVISSAMSVAEVKDVEIKDTELSEIVKEIYTHNLDTSEEKGA